MRRFLYALTSCLFLLLNGAISVQAQWLKQQQLTEKMALYDLAHSSPALFIHFDKTIYTNNETVWFTGYLLQAGSIELKNNNILSIALVRDADSSIIKQEKYFMTNGLSFGSMLLADSLLSGNYHFQATTNQVSKGIPSTVFMQPIVIKTNTDPAFNTQISLLEAGVFGKKPNQVSINVTTKDSRILPRPAEVTYQYGNVFKKAMTNISGGLVFSLDEQNGLKDPNVYVKVRYDKDSSLVNIPLPVTVRKAKVGFYPEGGNLVDGLPCKVAWEVRDQLLAAVTLTAQLFKDNKFVQTIETNSYGIGKFTLTPVKNSTYTVRLMHSGFADSTYKLPVASEDGVGLKVENAIADTLLITLSTKKPLKIALRIHDFKQTFLYKEISLAGAGQIFKVPIADFAKGLKSITVFDSLGRPLAERMIFAKYSSVPLVGISTDMDTYSQRQKVVLKLKLKDLENIDTTGFVSVACIQDARLYTPFNTDIESYTYLQHELGNLPLAPNGRGFEDKNYLEDMLMVKGWRRYTWQDISKTSAKDTLRSYDTLALKLKIKRFNNPVKEPVTIGMMKTGGGFLAKTTDKTGEIIFKNEELHVEYGKKINVFVTGKNQDGYTLTTEDPYNDLNKEYIKSVELEYTSLPSLIQNNQELKLKGAEKGVQLKEVRITQQKVKDVDVSFSSNTNRKGPNKCGDYICRYNILNCRTHYGDPTNHQPVEGQTYKLETQNGQLVSYKCKETEDALSEKHNGFSTVPIAGIYSQREYYVNDFSQPLEPGFISTIYWNPATMLHHKEQEFVFYTGDITGKFKVIVQGFTGTDLIYGQHYFEVKGK
jgi:hypothetical protein